MPVCWIIAGPNGAGKTTFALDYLPQVAKCRKFVNADLIAAGLSPLDPEREVVTASRLLLLELDSHIAQKQDFAFETTLSGRGYLRLIKRLQKEKWQVELLYLALPNVKMSLARVEERVAHGGHNISVKNIIRRFPRSLYNLLYDYGPLVDRARCFMNTGNNPVLVFEQVGAELTIKHEPFYKVLFEDLEK